MNDLGAVNPMLALAELMLNSDELRAQADDGALRAARQEQAQALTNETRALHEAADKTRKGAWAEGAMTMVGGAAAGFSHAITKAGDTPTGGIAGTLLEGGRAVEQMAGPLGRLVGEAPRQDREADAKQAEAQAADAGTRAELASHHHERLLDAQDRTIATLENIVESAAQGNWALIANV